MARETRNRNARRSQQMLQQAFSELLSEKPFDKITVTDITRRADLSRGTFYAHYASTSDLLSAMIDDIMDKLFEVVDVASTTQFLKNPEPVITLVRDYLTQDESLFRTLIGTSVADSFVVSMKQSVVERLLERVSPGEPFGDELSLRVGATCIVGGLIDLCCAWLRGEYGEASAEEVSAIAAQLVRSLGGFVEEGA